MLPTSLRFVQRFIVEPSSPLTTAILDRVEQAFTTAPTATFLRAADALHLATAAENGFTEIHSNDKHLLSAAPLFGLLGVNVIPPTSL